MTQTLAIANLLPRIRDLYRSEELGAADLQLLTMATKTQQRDWLNLMADHDAPTGQSLKGWLFGGQAIRAKVALFDLASFDGKIVGDLFSEDGYAPAKGGQVEGVYREPVQLVSGKFAVIEKSRDFTLVPWRPVLDRELGKPVQGIMRGDAVSWTLGRSRGPAIS